MVSQIVDALRPRPVPLAQIVGAADDHERERRRQPHGHHVGRDELAETDTRIEAARHQVHHLVARGDLQLDLGVSLAERGEHRLQDQRDDRPGNGEAQSPGGAPP